jgi:hypothetical protein
MSNPREQNSSSPQLAWHWMMGTALGVLCGGLRLVTALPESQLLIDDPASSLSRLVFLISIGLAFGIGATLTGAMFLRSEKS